MRAIDTALIGAITGTALVLSACATPERSTGDPLSGICQFEPCVCANEDAPFWQVPETAPIIWSQSRGAPACPRGFELKRSREE